MENKNGIDNKYVQINDDVYVLIEYNHNNLTVTYYLCSKHYNDKKHMMLEKQAGSKFELIHNRQNAKKAKYYAHYFLQRRIDDDFNDTTQIFRDADIRITNLKKTVEEMTAEEYEQYKMDIMYALQWQCEELDFLNYIIYGYEHGKQ